MLGLSCQRWHESRAEILMDENLPAWEKSRLIGYLRSKVVEPCPDTTFSDDTDTDRILELLEENEIDYFTLPHYGWCLTGASVIGNYTNTTQEIDDRTRQLGPRSSTI